MCSKRYAGGLRRVPLVVVMASSLLLTACDPVTLTVLGIGASTGVSYGLNSVAYKTFTVPLKRVNFAAKSALKNMGIKVEKIEKTKEGEVITAKSSDREIELTLEAVSNKTTRMRSIARQGSIFFDRATATEIIIQTEKVLVGA